MHLAIDTSSDICSVALVNDTELIKELNITDNKTHSENLMPLIDKLFKDTDFTLVNIDFIACSIGPRFIHRNSNRYCNCKGILYGKKHTSNWCYFFGNISIFC